MLGRCVFKADGADWLHTDKYTGQTKAKVWLVTLLNTHVRTQSHSRWHFVMVALRGVKGDVLENYFHISVSLRRLPQIGEYVGFF